jgi:predicted TIM-barrel fold metal-dependent hydrolase
MANQSAICSRRDFLAGGAAIGAAALIPAGGLAVPPITRRGLIDVHHHFLPYNYMAEEQNRLPSHLHGATSVDRLLNWNPEQALESMDQNGIERAIGSPSMPGVWFGDTTASRRLSRVWNEAVAQVIQRYPDRFGFFGVVAPPDTDGAIEEIGYALDRLSADGIALVSNYSGKGLGDPAFTPVLEELNRRAAVVYVHPTVAPCCAALTPGLRPSIIEYPADTTRTITSLLMSGTLARLGNIRWIFSHGGGTLPFLAHRIGEIARSNPEVGRGHPEGIEGLLRQVYCDTAAATGAPQLAAITAFFPSSHILYGSDYPFVSTSQAIADIDRYQMSPQLRDDIYRNNALRLLPNRHSR